MKKAVPVFLLFIILPLISALSGCLTKDSSVYGKEKVLEYVDSICPEPYELVRAELIEQSPDNMEYEFRTLKRDLTFHANSYLRPIQIDATVTSWYSRELSCDYVATVHGLYREKMKQILGTDSRYVEEDGWYYLLSFEDIRHAVDTLLAADQAYRPELQYNPPDFLLENPLSSIHFVWYGSEEDAAAREDWVNITDIGITGQNDGNTLYDRLANAYAQLYVDGEIGRNDVPEEYLADKHVSVLDTILLNGKEMLYDSEDNPYGPFGLTTDDYKYCWYSRELQSYMIAIDIGLTSDGMSFPLIIREYARALGGSWQVSSEEHGYDSSWTIGEDAWTMKAVFDDNTIYSLEIQKNGKPLDISWITSEDDRNVSATFCVGVTLEDFCRLFPLAYDVDEAGRTVSFQSL